MRREAMHTALYTATAIIARFGLLLFVPVFWRKLTPTDYGVIAVTELIGAFLGTFLILSLDAAVSRFYYEWPEADRPRRLGALWVVSWSSAVGLGVGSAGVLILLGSALFPDIPFYPYLFWGVLYAILGRLKFFTQTVLRIRQQPMQYSFLTLGGFALQLGLSLYWVVGREAGLEGYFWALNLSEGVSVLGCALWLSTCATPCVRGAGLRQALQFSVPLIPNTLLGNLAGVLDRWLLQHVASLEVLGLYAISLKFVNMLAVLHEALKMSFAPFLFKAVSEQGTRAAHLIGRVRLFYLWPLLLSGIGLAVLIEDFVRLAGRADYYPVAQYVPILVVPALVEVLPAYFGSGLLLAQRTDRMWIPTALRLLLTVVGGWLLIVQWQLVGVLVTRYLVAIPAVGLSIWLSQRYYSIPWDGVRLLSLGLGWLITFSAVWWLPIIPGMAGLVLRSMVVTAFGIFSLLVIIGYPFRLNLT